VRIAGQAQKELFHNEALQVLDCVAAASVEEPPRNDLPASAAEGATYIIGAAPTGVWSGKAGQLANMSAGGWRFVVPTDGMSALVKTNGLRAEYRSGGWAIGTVTAERVEVGGMQVLGAQGAAIASPSGGSTVDAEARSAIGLVLAAMRQHGLIAT
jgi:hypothetical protein